MSRCPYLAAVAITLAGCGGRAQNPWTRVLTSNQAGGAATWPLPAGWRTEVLPFPLDFAPSLSLRGVEELRFAPGFFDVAAPGYWSYAFAWRLEQPSGLDGPGLAAALVTYFRGLTVAVDEGKRIADTQAITAGARPLEGGGFVLEVVTYDPFTTGALVRLRGRAQRSDCGGGRELWRVALIAETAPPTMVDEVATLYRLAACGQTPVERAAPP